VQSSIDFKKVALQLEVVPLINSEKEVSLDILQKIDSVIPGSNVNIGGNSSADYRHPLHPLERHRAQRLDDRPSAG